MKRIKCPKCDNPIIFNETKYEVGRTLVFECEVCKKQFKIKITKPKTKEEKAKEIQPLAKLIVLENTFHQKQIISLFKGVNYIGRYMNGTNTNRPIKTKDPSIDTTQCSITIKTTKKGNNLFVLKDENSNTGSFYMEDFLSENEQVNLNDEDIFTIGATTIIFKNKDLDQI